MRKPRNSKTTVIEKTPENFVQCNIQKVVKDGGKMTKTCIHNDGINHDGPCLFFKVIKKKW